MRDAGHRTPDAGHRTSDNGHRTAKKAKIIYPPPRGVDIITIRAGKGAEKQHPVLALSQPARIRVTVRFSIYH